MNAAIRGLAAGNNILNAETKFVLLRAVKKFFNGHNMGKLLLLRLTQLERDRFVFTTSLDCAGITMKPTIIKNST